MKPQKAVLIGLSVLLLIMMAVLSAGEKNFGTQPYSKFEKPEACGSCHTDIYMQWTQAMMSQAYTHHWDEIEYFDLAVAHAQKVPSLKGPVDGCNGCHAPLAYLAGDVPPPRPSEGSRANESVSCDLCHSISGIQSDDSVPYNFSFVVSPGRIKYGAKEGVVSPHHETKKLDIFAQAELCANCHNEKNPFGVWVKSTQIEWLEGPYSHQGVPCQQCHMPKAWGRNAKMAKEDMVAQHLFNGAHDPGKIAGAIELRMHPEEREAAPGDVVVLKVQLFNGKAGHKIPTGSVEDRIMWLHVTARDSDGKEYHLPVDKKGFEGEEYTIAADVLAYVDMGVPKGIKDFKGVPRDGVPVGDRIFRMPYFDPNGIMTILQWNTARLGVDYRIGPRETKIETFTWQVPDDIPLGKVTFRAQLNYQKLVKPVADFLGVPAEESEIVPVNFAETWIQVVD
ncbi:MAG: multiheme c-type cytochrome [candidate division KSB1 bacterium]|nr:multiheme c-type cytochrome [candidate division KSB1 bacterium]